MTDETRDIAIEARTDIRQIKDMLREHILETRQHRDGLIEKVETIEEKLQNHNDLIQQIKGAKVAVSSIAAVITTVGVGTLAKVFGVIR